MNKVDERPSDWPIGCSSGGVSNCRPIYLPPHPVMWYVTSNASRKLPALFMQRVYVPTYLAAAGFNVTSFRFFFPLPLALLLSLLSLFFFLFSALSLFAKVVRFRISHIFYVPSRSLMYSSLLDLYEWRVSEVFSLTRFASSRITTEYIVETQRAHRIVRCIHWTNYTLVQQYSCNSIAVSMQLYCYINVQFVQWWPSTCTFNRFLFSVYRLDTIFSKYSSF